ncbi:MAG: hypothetical protein ACRDNW_01070 [Trebonia sp.]
MTRRSCVAHPAVPPDADPVARGDGADAGDDDPGDDAGADPEDGVDAEADVDVGGAAGAEDVPAEEQPAAATTVPTASALPTKRYNESNEVEPNIASRSFSADGAWAGLAIG